MMRITNITAILLAAGQGTRMKSRLPKVLHQLLGQPLISYPIQTLKTINITDILVVVGYQADKVMEALAGEGVRFVVQEPQLGTGHAVQVAMKEVPAEADTVMVLCGDVPLISAESIENLRRWHEERKSAVTVQTVELPDGAHYGRVVRDETGQVLKVVQAKDAAHRPEILAIREINTGAYCFDAHFLRRALGKLEPSPVTGEIYLTDMIELARKEGRRVEALKDPDWPNLLGINTRKELADALQTLRRRINEAHMDQGVTLVDPDTVYIGPRVRIGQDTVIYPNVYLEGNTAIGENCIIEPQVKISDSYLGNRVYVKMGSVITESRLADGVQVGPYSHLRPLSDLREGVRVGNFVEVKKSILYQGVKANHLTYLGDAEVGAGTNVGAGTITCNYDGVHKHKTVIGEGAFIGSNTALVAPVTIGAGAYVGAGSTITEDVPPGKLGLGRARQVIKERRKGPKETAPDSEPLSLESLARELRNLNLECAPELLEDLLQEFRRCRVTTVSIFREVANPENLTLIRRMCTLELEEPSNYEVAVNLAHLAWAQRKASR
jgi:bifunctional UDP-N-acetylglucosamine pyrophosphorylase/glucosamine-1-phosphate N-acetyltransferase